MSRSPYWWLRKPPSAHPSQQAKKASYTSLNAYGSGFKRAGLELVKRINTGTSLTHGLERVTVKQRLAEAKPG
jgi:hypothetical protein